MNTLWGGHEQFLMCSLSLFFFANILPPTAASSSFWTAERAVGSRVTSSPNTQHQQEWEWDSKGFWTDNSWEHLNEEKLREEKRRTWGPFHVIVSFFIPGLKRGSRGQSGWECVLLLRGLKGGNAVRDWLSVPEETRWGLRKPLRLIYH